MNWKDTLAKERGTIFSKFALQLLFIMFFVEFVKGALIITFLPVYMKNELGASTFVIGWTLAAQYIGDNLLRTPLGWVIDRIGYRITMLIGVIATLASVAMIAYAPGYVWIIAACALLGIGTAPLWPCVITGTTEIAGDNARGTIMSVVYIAWLSGVGLGPFVITYFIGAGKHAAAFRLLLLMMTAVVLVALFLPGKLAGKKEGHDGRAWGREPHVPRMERIRRYMSEVGRSVTVSKWLFPAMFAQTFALGLLTPILTIYATNVLRLSGGQFRLFLILGGAVTVGLMVPVGKLVDRWGTRWFLNVGFLLGSIVLTTFSFVRSLPLLYVVVMLLGLSYAMIIPAWNALIAAVIPPEKRGAVWGFFLTIEGAGTTIGPIVSGMLWDSLGPHAPFVTSGAVLLAVFAIQTVISNRSRVVVR